MPCSFTHLTHYNYVERKLATIICDSLKINVNGQSYQQVRGTVKAYQFGTTDTFVRWANGRPIGGSDDIESPYVDGISITHGQSPRKHVWTYAVGWCQFNEVRDPDPRQFRDLGSCPSTGYAQPRPDFVGDNYFCSSGNPGPENPSNPVTLFH